MTIIGKPTITQTTEQNYTEIIFELDSTKFPKFEFDEKILKKMLLDIQFSLLPIKEINAYFNKTKYSKIT